MGDSVEVSEDRMAPIQEAALAMFPNICPNHLAKLAVDYEYNVQNVIDAILQDIERGNSFPKRSPRQRKRKRSSSTEEPEDKVAKFLKAFTDPERKSGRDPAMYHYKSKILVQQDFPSIYSKDLDNIFKEQGDSLFKTYLFLGEKTLAWDGNKPPWREKKRGEKKTIMYARDHLDQTIRNCENRVDKATYEEFRAAREIHDAKVNERNAEAQAVEAEEQNTEQAMRDGTMTDCGCCCVDFPLNRMVHCQAETNNMHWFCKECARRTAETAIGLQKHDFRCMSMDGCEQGFSRDQIEVFLDEKTRIALDRIEMENSLRMSGIENLESCPFCPFAAECCPVEDDREFRCQNEDCQIVSCRLCREETHIPQTCEEAARDKGVSARRKIEEAMSAALIRKCNTCGTPFIKEHGCNKMTCSKCGNRQCYVCGKSCDYAHFDDPARGGQSGNCPLFDNTVGLEQRHQDEVRLAEEAARAQVQSENPDIGEDLLKIKVSDKVKDDEERRRAVHGPARVVNFGLGLYPIAAPGRQGGLIPQPPNGANGPQNLAEMPRGADNENILNHLNLLIAARRHHRFRLRMPDQRPHLALKPRGEQTYDAVVQKARQQGLGIYDAIRHHEATNPGSIYVPDRAVPGDLTVEQRVEINGRFKVNAPQYLAHLQANQQANEEAPPNQFPIPPAAPPFPRARQAQFAPPNPDAPGGQPENPIVINDRDKGPSGQAVHQGPQFAVPHRPPPPQAAPDVFVPGGGGDFRLDNQPAVPEVQQPRIPPPLMLQVGNGGFNQLPHGEHQENVHYNDVFGNSQELPAADVAENMRDYFEEVWQQQRQRHQNARHQQPQEQREPLQIHQLPVEFNFNRYEQHIQGHRHQLLMQRQHMQHQQMLRLGEMANADNNGNNAHGVEQNLEG
ncbi:hypothetical protein MKZ38_003170 [Zalerion maritima]|uniref:RING-type domain-containing protein n=1 Tax=Zalerion maritima TaxID=339359 RepID=A0AAD5S0Z7_9PEZI|nr:hypothetical protein MKZ38_003170 [Zalerion maritima]